MNSSPRAVRISRTATRIILGVALLFFSIGWTSRSSHGDEPAKIWLAGDLLLRAVPDEGITMYDIAQPATPRIVGSIALTNNHDIAVAGTTLYADSGNALLIYDIANPAQPRRVARMDTVFSHWQYTPMEYVIESGGGWGGCNACGSNQYDVAAPVAANTSQGGSLARFSVVGNHLYCIDESALIAFDISTKSEPKFLSRTWMPWTIETLFPVDSLLFIGGTSGMSIYSIADPAQPKFVSEFEHARVCDPVVVEGDTAYVTLRGGSMCGGYTNQLDIIDISTITAPRLLTTYELTGPYGLTVRNGVVVVCDGVGGLRTIDTRASGGPKQTGIINTIEPHDVILRDDLLIVTAEDGYHLYNATDLAALQQFSRIVP